METMTTDSTTKTPHWAATLGAEVAKRRAERLAEHRAEEEAAGVRAQVPPEKLARRFTDTAVLVVAAVDAFATAAEIRIDSDPVAAGALQLKTDNDRLRLLRQDDAIAVEFRGRSRAETRSFDLGCEPFSAEAVAREIAEQWISQLSAGEGLGHVTR